MCRWRPGPVPKDACCSPDVATTPHRRNTASSSHRSDPMLTRRTVGSALLGALSVLSGARQSSLAQTIPDNRADQIKAAGKTMAFAAPGGDLGRILKAILADFTSETGIRVAYLEGPLLDLYGRIKAE